MVDETINFSKIRDEVPGRYQGRSRLILRAIDAARSSRSYLADENSPKKDSSGNNRKAGKGGVRAPTISERDTESMEMAAGARILTCLDWSWASHAYFREHCCDIFDHDATKKQDINIREQEKRGNTLREREPLQNLGPPVKRIRRKRCGWTSSDRFILNAREGGNGSLRLPVSTVTHIDMRMKSLKGPLAAAAAKGPGIKDEESDSRGCSEETKKDVDSCKDESNRVEDEGEGGEQEDQESDADSSLKKRRPSTRLESRRSGLTPEKTKLRENLGNSPQRLLRPC